MEKYNYYEAVKSDLEDYIRENYDQVSKDDWSDIYDNAFISDKVTGNASGSYFHNTWKAEEAICHNMDLLIEAAHEFGYSEVPREWLEIADAADVSIRCYIMGQELSDAIDEIIKEREEKCISIKSNTNI